MSELSNLLRDRLREIVWGTFRISHDAGILMSGKCNLAIATSGTLDNLMSGSFERQDTSRRFSYSNEPTASALSLICFLNDP